MEHLMEAKNRLGLESMKDQAAVLSHLKGQEDIIVVDVSLGNGSEQMNTHARGQVMVKESRIMKEDDNLLGPRAIPLSHYSVLTNLLSDDQSDDDMVDLGAMVDGGR